jgi:hypothetical protein
MVFGISLIVIGALGTAGLTAFVATAPAEAAAQAGAVAALGPQSTGAVAAGVAIVAASALLIGVYRVLRVRERRGLVIHLDETARAAEQESRARLLELRLEQLQREVEMLELRRAGGLGELHAPLDLIDGDDGDGPMLVIVPDDGSEPTELSRRLAAAPIRRSLRG